MIIKSAGEWLISKGMLILTSVKRLQKRLEKIISLSGSRPLFLAHYEVAHDVDTAKLREGCECVVSRWREAAADRKQGV